MDFSYMGFFSTLTFHFYNPNIGNPNIDLESKELVKHGLLTESAALYGRTLFYTYKLTFKGLWIHYICKKKLTNL